MPGGIFAYVDVGAQNQFSEWLDVPPNERTGVATLDVSVFVPTAFSGTIVLQRKRPAEADGLARDVESYTTATEKVAETRGRWYWRIGCKTGGFTSGGARCELSTTNP